MKYKKSLKIFFKKKHVIEVGSILALLILASLFKLSVDILKKNDIGTRNDNQIATLAINFDDWHRSFEGEVVENTTVLDILNIAMAVGKIKLNYVLDDKNQTWITEINDHINKVGSRRFMFFVNGKQIDSKDLNKIFLKVGDNIVINHE